jgi:hypothetical protein
MVILRLVDVSASDLSGYAWASLRRFQDVEYVASEIMRWHGLDNHKRNVKKQATQIRYCLTQAREYFLAAKSVTLATKPNLLYYGTLSLALAEILFKQSGDSSLDRARQTHRHHGLIFAENLPRATGYSGLAVSAQGLRAMPLEIDGKRRGTFELWHTSARESPIGGTLSIVHENIGSTTRFEMLMSAAGDRLPPLPSAGITLRDCLASIPTMLNFIPFEGLESNVGRAKIQRTVFRNQNRHETTLTFHPSKASDHLFNTLRFEPAWIDRTEVKRFPNGFSWSYTADHIVGTPKFRLPHACMYTTDEIRFWTEDQPLNQFGLFYVALFIAGNFARYYPDIWLREVERSSALARAIEELTNQAEEWVPWLTLSELSRALFVKRP